MHYDLSAYSFPTILLAFALAFVFASCTGVPHMKVPEESELTMAQVLTGRFPRRRNR